MPLSTPVHPARLAGALASVLCLSLLACGQSSKPGLQQSVPAANSQAGPAGALPAAGTLPFPNDRADSGLTEYVIQGKHALARSLNATDNGTAIFLNAGGGVGPEWAEYRFNAGSNPPDSVSVLLDSGSLWHAYVGLANFSTGRWEFSGPYTKQKTFAIDDDKHVSPSGNIWVAVVAAGGQDATVDALSIRTINPDNQPPTASYLFNAVNLNAPALVDLTAAASTDSDGTLVEYAWDWDGDGAYDAFTDNPVISHVFTDWGDHQVKLRVTDDQFAHATQKQTISINAQPTAVISALPGTAAPPGTTLTLSAAGSDDPDGIGPNHYSWDLDGDFVFETDTGSVPQTQCVLRPTPGHQRVTLAVGDGLGGVGYASLTLTAQGWALPVKVDNVFQVADNVRSAIVNGNPALAAADNSAGHLLHFARAKDADGAQWNAPVTPVSDANTYCSLLVVNGFPALSYFSAAGTLKYVLALDVNGSTWGTPVTVDATSNSGPYCSLALIDGRPAIGYYIGGALGDLYYVRALDNAGAAWGTPKVLDTVGATGVYANLTVVDGFPAISYQDGSLQHVRYVRATDVDGNAAWNTPITVVSTGGTGQYDALLIVAGNPAISYYDASVGLLKYVRALDQDGVTWGLPVSADTQANSGGFTCMTLYQGRPVIAYALESPAQLRVVTALDEQGKNWGAPQVVTLGWFSSIINIGDGLGVAYSPSLSSEQDFVRLY